MGAVWYIKLQTIVSCWEEYCESLNQRVWSLKHHRTQPILIFNRENPQNSKSPTGPRGDLISKLWLVYFGTILFYLQGTFRQDCLYKLTFCLIYSILTSVVEFLGHFSTLGIFFNKTFIVYQRRVNAKNYANQFIFFVF